MESYIYLKLSFFKTIKSSASSQWEKNSFQRKKTYTDPLFMFIIVKFPAEVKTLLGDVFHDALSDAIHDVLDDALHATQYM